MRCIFDALRLAPLFLLAALSGCVTPVKEYVPTVRDVRTLEPLRTSDPAVIKQRFGDLGLAAGHAFGYRNDRVLSVVLYRWAVEGVALREQTLKCANYLIGDASCDDWTYLIYFNQAQNALVFQGGEAFAIGRVQPDGSVVVDRPGYANYTETFNPATGELKMGTMLGDYALHDLTNDEVRAMREEQSHFLANLARKDAENSAFWANVSQAVLVGAQTYANERQQQLAQEQQQREYEASVRAAQVAEQRRAPAERSRQQAARRAEQARQQAAQRAHAPTRPAAPSAHALQEKPVTPPLPARNVAMATSSPPVPKPSVTAAKPEARTNKPELFPYPEAVVVCTFPDAKGHFSCDDPLHTNEAGGPNAMQQDRTPESKVASIKNDVCKGAHRLRSSTHLVWGCGFAATGVSPYMDRAGPGVDVHGRQTYYCPKDYPFNCANTKP